MSDIVYTTEELTLLADALITATSKHLKLEFEKGRIIGADYAQAYAAISSNAMNQAMQFLLTKDSAGIQADILNEQKAQAIDNTTISNASVPDRITISSNQAIMSGTQSDTLLIQKEIMSEQKAQAIDQTSLSNATLQDRIAAVVAQTDIVEIQVETTGYQRDITSEQKLQAIDLTTVSASTIQDRIDGIAAQTNLSEEQLAVMRERHGINKTPAFP